MMQFYKDKKVFITGHTGFKGSWMCQVLLESGANVYGYALEPPTNPSLFNLAGLSKEICSIQGDIRDLVHLKESFQNINPDIVIHMAAQPLVREAYKNPVYTYEVNVMGTVNVMECIRNTDSVSSAVNVTTDKVYLNKEWTWGYRENEELNGYDPYSNSKSCSELVTSSYKNSFFKEKRIPVSTARAGNVIGGGDFALDRIVPDCIRAVNANEKIIVRNPHSIRPYQHVLDPIYAYLMIAEKQYQNMEYADNYNVGPNEDGCLTTGQLVDVFCDSWKRVTGKETSWIDRSDDGPHEAEILRLDCSKMKHRMSWKPIWNTTQAIEKVVEWQNDFNNGLSADGCMQKQIREFEEYKRK